MTTRLQISLAAVALAVLPAMPAIANERSPEIQVSSGLSDHGVRTSAVTYADLNLRNEAGVARLASRVRSAVKLVCAPRNYTDLKQLRPTLACEHDSMDRGKADIAVAVAKATGERTAALAPVQVAMRNR